MLFKFCLFMLFLVSLSDCTLSPNSPKKAKKTKELKLYAGPQNFTPFDKNLVIAEPSAKDILVYNEAYFQKTDEWNFKGTVLGYVTPWNNLGYDIAKIFANKFTHISPVWLQVKKNDKKEGYEVKGTHDIDEGWMRDVKKAGSKRKTKIVPRILFDGWKLEHAFELIGDDNKIQLLSKTFVKLCKQYKFDGLVIELWLQLAGRIMRPNMLEFIKKVGIYMSEANLDMFLVVPPNRGETGPGDFTEHDFEYLQKYVTGFSLMTYDYSNVHRPGANAPLEWVEECIKYASTQENREQILTGLNFYGYAYSSSGGGPIIGRDYLSYVKDYNSKLKYDSESKENFFEVKRKNGKNYVFYPTLHSVNERINLAKQMNSGISIWELGQGLNYFYDLL